MNLQEAQAQAARSLVAEAVASMPGGMAGFQATVTVLSPLTVRWQGVNVRAKSKGRSYTPVVGDQVLVLLINNGAVVVDAVDPV